MVALVHCRDRQAFVDMIGDSGYRVAVPLRGEPLVAAVRRPTSPIGR
ncbi:hypothetical protein PS467_02335 [Streptomyces luomodiensis]|uniref:Uncharacterized protein n=1 Tax=Streptomyces luomodiensis TaxID=3026192 RepID=A0ABY9UP14_9ACTN|nr:hypothetical protein [Streptomyces sp. SCA4-21]WNE94243.1 hypothetical protein PS467_02335 [Streptomyces sp. SCA4-21]